ncbi:GntR family transcriptional regulator [Sinomonas sp. G460-2]|uniref:GntR family transcriptional regulator n=1 Tax=Sinomonas sp. G460-2 TaxID=3393464 RepID=UPI0039F0D6B7
MIDPQSRPSLAETAYRALQDRLLTLEIRPGDPLNDEVLARDLGFGRTPVREALKRLEVDRLVVTYPRRGTFATPVEVTDLAYISEIRSQLEPLAAARAARLASPSSRLHLATLIGRVRNFDTSQSSVSETLRFDADIHRGIYAAAGNPHLEDALVHYDNLATRIWCLVMDRLPGLGGHLHEHVALLQAVIDGKEGRAAELSALHVEGFEQAVRSALFAA